MFPMSQKRSKTGIVNPVLQYPTRFSGLPGTQLLSQRKLGCQVKAGVSLVGQKTQQDSEPRR